MTGFLAAQLAKSHYSNISAARRDFDYVPRVSTEDGLRLLIDWLREGLEREGTRRSGVWPSFVANWSAPEGHVKVAPRFNAGRPMVNWWSKSWRDDRTERPSAVPTGLIVNRRNVPPR